MPCQNVGFDVLICDILHGVCMRMFFFSEFIEKYGGKYKGGRVNENGLSEFKSNHYCQFIRCLCSYESCNPFQGLNLY